MPRGKRKTARSTARGGRARGSKKAKADAQSTAPIATSTDVTEKAKQEHIKEDQLEEQKQHEPSSSTSASADHSTTSSRRSTPSTSSSSSAHGQQPATAAAAEKKSDELPPQEFESGKIYFLYRPKLDVEEAHSLDEVQRTYILLVPRPSHSRLIMIAKKRLPDPEKHERFFAFVEEVGPMKEVETKHLEPYTHTTKTRGDRHYAGARILAEGRYTIASHHVHKHKTSSSASHGHNHLAYVLETPHEPGEAQAAFHLEKEGSFIIQIKNPHRASSSFSGISLKSKVHFPERLQAKFGDYAFIPVEPELLDYVGAEMIFIGASSHPEEELGDVGQHLVDKVHEPESEKQVRMELHMPDIKTHPADPLTTGHWPSETSSSSASDTSAAITTSSSSSSSSSTVAA